jgi:hypothetical protein
MARIYGNQRQDDSNRCRTGALFYDHAPAPLTGDAIVRHCGTTSEYGPGRGEPYTMAQVYQEVTRLRRRLERENAPYGVLNCGTDRWALVPKR